MKKGHADWLGLIIQFICGFVVGVIIGFALIARRYRAGWAVDDGVVAYFVIGTGLVTGAIASQIGDRLWMENFSSFIFPDDSDIQQSNFSRIFSILVGITGAGMMIYAILTTMKVI